MTDDLPLGLTPGQIIALLEIHLATVYADMPNTSHEDAKYLETYELIQKKRRPVEAGHSIWVTTDKGCMHICKMCDLCILRPSWMSEEQT